MNRPIRCTVTNVLQLVAALLIWGGAAGAVLAAQVAGTVTHLSGPLVAKKADGRVKILATKSTVEEGDTLVAEKDTYARIKFIDDSEITLRPGSQFKIDSFFFEEDKPEKDTATFNLIKGGLRAVTGALGKRSKERFGMNTPTATIGIRGTIFIAEYVPPDAAAGVSYGQASVAAADDRYSTAATVSDTTWNGAPLEILPMRLAQASALPGTGNEGGRAPGLYVQVIDGMINLTNSGGSQNFAAGQFGYSANALQIPIVVQGNPGMQFSPPPEFSSSTGPEGSSTSSSESGNVDCEVR